MGVDYFPCDRCNYSICDCGDWERCNDECGRRWCGDECAKADGRRYDEDTEEYTCNFCRKEDAEDSELLAYILAREGWDREAVVTAYFADEENDNVESDYQI